ncbi:MAG: TIM44-like domain-containing protein [Betaproteobacteria bacterium]|jgi:predicted lipid-binding transport protein (Tim44 family)|nr:TIM44-like domain-containing protein [Betaproteobacteria bacterium]
MKAFWTAVVALVLTVGLFSDDAEARRFGGARTIGAQRNVTAPQTPSQSAASAQQPQAPQAAARPAMGRWLAPLAALAAGLGLAAVFGEQMGTLIVALLIVFVVVLAFRLIARGMQPRTDSRQQAIHYAGLGRETVAAPPPSQLPSVAAVPGVGKSAARIPVGFDVEGFLRQARKSFIALQAANDRGDLKTIHDLVTEEMFDALERDAGAQSTSGGHTDVVKLNADLLEVATESGMHWASIRFSGMLREERDGALTPFNEVWNLRKPEKGRSGWLLAGIQQVS